MGTHVCFLEYNFYYEYFLLAFHVSKFVIIIVLR